MFFEKAWHQGLAGKLNSSCRPPQPRTFAIAIAGRNAGIDQQAQWLFPYACENHCMKPGLFVTLTMVKHEKNGQCSLPSGGCAIA